VHWKKLLPRPRDWKKRKQKKQPPSADSEKKSEQTMQKKHVYNGSARKRLRLVHGHERQRRLRSVRDHQCLRHPVGASGDVQLF